jgi:hypothetical protein
MNSYRSCTFLCNQLYLNTIKKISNAFYKVEIYAIVDIYSLPPSVSATDYRTKIESKPL